MTHVQISRRYPYGIVKCRVSYVTPTYSYLHLYPQQLWSKCLKPPPLCVGGGGAMVIVAEDVANQDGFDEMSRKI
jgi:hypothetical protein